MTDGLHRSTSRRAKGIDMRRMRTTEVCPANGTRGNRRGPGVVFLSCVLESYIYSWIYMDNNGEARKGYEDHPLDDERPEKEFLGKIARREVCRGVLHRRLPR